MSSVDMGLFGLDCFVTDKEASSLDGDINIQELESLLHDHSTQNILDMSLQQSGITEQTHSMESMQVGRGPRMG